MRGLLWGVAVAWLSSSVALAQDAPDPFAVPDDANDTTQSPFVEVPPEVPVTDLSCMPQCRAGFTCVSGECVSACNPACPAGHVCASDGACIPEAVLNAPAPAMCSPACPAGMVCSPAGSCVVPGTIVGPTYAPAAPIVPTFDRRMAAKASSRGVFSLVSAGIAWGLGFASGAYRLQDENCVEGFYTDCDDSPLPEAAIGGVMVIFTAIVGPIASGGGRAGRRAGGEGIGALRAIGWISYALTLVGGVAMLAAAGVEADVPSPALFAAAALGGTSFLCFGIDALVAGKSARARANETQRNLSTQSAGSAAHVAPAVSLWRESYTDALRPAMGLRLTF